MALPDLTKIKMILMDLDGCLTTGHLLYFTGDDGNHIRDAKVFHTHDGYGIARGVALGMKFAVISGKSSPVNKMRTDKLGIHHLYENIDDKLVPFEELKKSYGFKNEEFAYIGDDEFDIPLLKAVGFSACPESGVAEVKKHVHHVCELRGGYGAVREFIDMVLKAQNKI
jgi:3-deoxy-D-manno-octulosonate 8-phosphate phosphatase (KDO 8-P phosphatase)